MPPRGRAVSCGKLSGALAIPSRQYSIFKEPALDSLRRIRRPAMEVDVALGATRNRKRVLCDALSRSMTCHCDGGWVCEAHPDQPWPHPDATQPDGECAGARNAMLEPGLPALAIRMAAEVGTDLISATLFLSVSAGRHFVGSDARGGSREIQARVSRSRAPTCRRPRL